MSKLLVVSGFVGVLSVLAASHVSAQVSETRTSGAPSASVGVTLDQKKAWFGDAIDDVLTGSSPLPTVGRSEADAPRH